MYDKFFIIQVKNYIIITFKTKKKLNNNNTQQLCWRYSKIEQLSKLSNACN